MTEGDDSNSHVGPIIFADETARQQLVEEGEVITFRKSQRTTGDTWWRTSRTGPKEGDVTVSEIGEVSPRIGNLEEYRDLSGFPTEEHWVIAIEDLNGGLPDTGYLYRAEVR